MKKIGFSILQLVSIFLFIAIFAGVIEVVKRIFSNKESFEYNLGYALGGIVLFGLLLWLNLKLFRYSNRK